MVTDNTLTLEFATGAVSPDGTYGSSGRTYGELNWSYGQVATDPTSLAYQLTAFPGWGPRTPDWEYRQWDTTPVLEISLLDDNGTPIDYSVIASAVLVLTQTNYGGFRFYSPEFPLTVGADRLTRTWALHDLCAVGRYRVTVRVTFDSGRTMTIPSTDDASFVVRDGERQ